MKDMQAHTYSRIDKQVREGECKASGMRSVEGSKRQRSSSARQCRAMSKVSEPYALKMSTRWPLSAEAAERCPSPRAGIAKRGTDRAPEQPRANTGECRRTKAADCQSWPNVGPDGIHGSVLLERSTNECGKHRAHRAEELTPYQAYRAAERRTGYQSGRAPSTPSAEHAEH
jgi:hypothetical protein